MREWAAFIQSVYVSLWGEAPPAALERVPRIRQRERVSWGAESREAGHAATGRVYGRGEWIKPEEKTILYDEMNRRLESMSPRLWQKFCHWRRHHFGSKTALA